MLLFVLEVFKLIIDTQIRVNIQGIYNWLINNREGGEKNNYEYLIIIFFFCK
jgi:hypothetical protein